MSRYWVIAPIESKPPELFDRIWQFDLTNNLISIGWSRLGDISRMHREELAVAVATAYPDKPSATKALFSNMLWAFYHEISPGDLIIARRGRKALAGVGKATQSAFFDPTRNPPSGHGSFLGVEWFESPRDKSFSSVVFPMHTVAEISADQYRNLLGSPHDMASPPEDIEDPSAFVLERYLEDFIVSNFDVIFKKKLRIYEDSEGNDGQQYTTDIGPIDILAISPESDRFVVIELKKGRSSDVVVGQILRYMGWVKKNLCKDGQSVEGLIICRDSDPKLAFALEMTSNINLRFYTVSFKLSESL